MRSNHTTSLRIFTILLGVFFTLQSIFAQDTIGTPETAQEDLKVGLVLSGGGAKGFAHIGVLKIIEQSGIRIDYIGGTSIGAIVGSLYSAGYSADELDYLFRNLDFESFIQDELPRESKTFYEREDAEKYALTLPFDNFEIELPKGLSRGQNLYNEYSRLTAHVNHINDFSKLPIPFFCMATDVVSGKQVFLDKGYLPKAILASSALPTVFNPVEIDGILMTDGGVANNYPVEEMIAKGAEVVIGVDVQDTLMRRDQINSAMDIMMQISNFYTIKEMEKKIPATSVYIKPSIKGYTLMSFDKISELIGNGRMATQDRLKELKKIAARQKKRKSEEKISRKSDTIYIQSLKIEGNKRYSRSYIKGKLKLRKTPKITTFQELNEGINNIVATGNFDQVEHRLLPDAGREILTLKLKESKNKMLLRMGVHYDNLYETAGLLNVTRKRVLFDDDILSADLILGDNIRWNLDYYIDHGFYWSYGFKANYVQFDKSVAFNFAQQFGDFSDININTIGIDYKNLDVQIYLETLLKQTFSVDLGLEYQRLSIISDTFGEDEDQIARTVFDNNDYWSAFGTIKYDSYDNKYFPKSGFLFYGNLHGYLFSSKNNTKFSEFSIAKAKFGYATPLTSTIALETEVEAGTKIGNTEIRSLDFLLGGFGAKTVNNFVSFYGYDFMNITGQSFAKAQISLDYEIIKKNHLNVSANFANVGNKLFSTGNWLQVPDYTGYALGYGLETFAGPIQVKYTYSPELKENQWFFSLGFWF